MIAFAIALQRRIQARQPLRFQVKSICSRSRLCLENFIDERLPSFSPSSGGLNLARRFNDGRFHLGEVECL